MSVASIGFLLRRPRLLGWVVVPFLINVAVMLLLLFLMGQFVVDPLMEVADRSVGWWVGPTLLFVAKMILMVLIFLMGGIVSFFLFSVVASPFNDFLTEDIEKELLAGRPDLRAPPMRLRDAIGHSLRDALLRLVVVTPLIIFGFFVGFVPVIGPILAAAITLSNGVIFLSLDAFGYAMDRRRMLIGEKIRWLMDHRSIWFPFGIGLSVLVAIPCNALLLPMLGAVAATRLYCEERLRLPAPEPGQKSGAQGSIESQ